MLMLSADFIEVACSLPQGSGEGGTCGVIMRYKSSERSAIIKHIRENHLQITTRKTSGVHVVCPDDHCLCRFQSKDCSELDPAGRPIPHRTHVTDYLRHYMDRHLSKAEKYTCGVCGTDFTRHGSLIRHQKNGTKTCPRQQI
jgi:hypothetical protein